MNPRERKFVLALAVMATTSAIITGPHVAADRSRQRREAGLQYVSKEEIELRTPIKSPPVLVIDGEVEGRDFEIVMRGFTNYFRKETWGRAKGQRSFMGGQKAGGYAVEIRTESFSGQWQQGWRGTHGGGGGGGREEYQGDLPPGRDLWNSHGFVGPRFEYEAHKRVWNEPDHSLQWKEEYEGRIPKGQIWIPKKIIWSESGRDYSSRWSRQPREFKIRSFKFQEEPLVEWFEARVKEYFPPQAIFGMTNTAPKFVARPTHN